MNKLRKLDFHHFCLTLLEYSRKIPVNFLVLFVISLAIHLESRKIMHLVMAGYYFSCVTRFQAGTKDA